MRRYGDNAAGARRLAREFVGGATRGQAGALYIHGETIYSYGPHFPVAAHTGDGRIAVTTRKPPSRTTAAHLGAVRRAAEEAGVRVARMELVPEGAGPSGYANPRRPSRERWLLIPAIPGRRPAAWRAHRYKADLIAVAKRSAGGFEWMVFPYRRGDRVARGLAPSVAAAKRAASAAYARKYPPGTGLNARRAEPWQTNARAFYTIKPGDVNKYQITAFGRPWPVQSLMGRIMPHDVGKRVYQVGRILQVENEEQRARRLRGKNPRRRGCPPGKRWHLRLRKCVGRARYRQNPLTEVEVGKTLGCAECHFSAAAAYIREGCPRHAAAELGAAIAHANDVIAMAEREKGRLQAQVAKRRYMALQARVLAPKGRAREPRTVGMQASMAGRTGLPRARGAASNPNGRRSFPPARRNPGQDIRIVGGQKIRTWGGWYRHDSVYVGGVKLEGHIQVMRRAGRIEAITCFRDKCVVGSYVDWLIRMNREAGVIQNARRGARKPPTRRAAANAAIPAGWRHAMTVNYPDVSRAYKALLRDFGVPFRTRPGPAGDSIYVPPEHFEYAVGAARGVLRRLGLLKNARRTLGNPPRRAARNPDPELSALLGANGARRAGRFA